MPLLWSRRTRGEPDYAGHRPAALMIGCPVMVDNWRRRMSGRDAGTWPRYKLR